jgi:hypothetical protein
MIAPTKLLTGIDYRWVASHATYKSDAYTLTVAIAGPVNIPVTTTNEDDGSWQCEISGTDITDTGLYSWSARVTDVDNDYRLIASGTLSVVPDLATVDTPYDGRSMAQKILDNIDAAIASLTQGKPVSNYSIEGRSATYYSLPDLITLRDKYQRIVAQEKDAERLANGLKSSRTIRTRFI